MSNTCLSEKEIRRTGLIIAFHVDCAPCEVLLIVSVNVDGSKEMMLRDKRQVICRSLIRRSTLSVPGQHRPGLNYAGRIYEVFAHEKIEEHKVRGSHCYRLPASPREL